MLGCAEGKSNQQVAAELGIRPQTVGKWRRRFLEVVDRRQAAPDNPAALRVQDEGPRSSSRSCGMAGNTQRCAGSASDLCVVVPVDGADRGGRDVERDSVPPAALIVPTPGQQAALDDPAAGQRDRHRPLALFAHRFDSRARAQTGVPWTPTSCTMAVSGIREQGRRAILETKAKERRPLTWIRPRGVDIKGRPFNCGQT
ncbi:helix-turn-helix domain-containing protein [Streptomyces sp. NPDC006309]|uniref:helix-turn-helix domain-containing protein n=1 Tax=Streptomyces sp. NPDC006309 TaxID=3156749 RepID=UPI0033B1C891